MLSISFDAASISDAPEFWDSWLDGSDFREFLTVEAGEHFAYQSVYDNNTYDAHPPLFYFLLHTVCSLFPGVYSPWLGIVMNIVLMVFA